MISRETKRFLRVVCQAHVSVRRDAALHDLWSPVASKAEARIVRRESGGVRARDSAMSDHVLHEVPQRTGEGST